MVKIDNVNSLITGAHQQFCNSLNFVQLKMLIVAVTMEIKSLVASQMMFLQMIANTISHTTKGIADILKISNKIQIFSNKILLTKL